MCVCACLVYIVFHSGARGLGCVSLGSPLQPSEGGPVSEISRILQAIRKNKSLHANISLVVNQQLNLPVLWVEWEMDEWVGEGGAGGVYGENGTVVGVEANSCKSETPKECQWKQWNVSVNLLMCSFVLILALKAADCVFLHDFVNYFDVVCSARCRRSPPGFITAGKK